MLGLMGLLGLVLPWVNGCRYSEAGTQLCFHLCGADQGWEDSVVVYGPSVDFDCLVGRSVPPPKKISSTGRVVCHGPPPPGVDITGVRCFEKTAYKANIGKYF